MGFQFRDQGSSSSQSTAQSYGEVAGMEGSNPYGKCITSSKPGCNQSHDKPLGHHIRSAMPMGTLDYNSQVDYNQSTVPIPVAYAEPYFGALLASAYGSQALINHPQAMMGIAPGRVPLPLDFPHDEPIYVNAKQYRGILRRRQYRAKLEAQNKLVKNRRPYLHESRHLHALKRVRGAGGRFLNTKKLEELKLTSTSGGQDTTTLAQFNNVAGNTVELKVRLQSDFYREVASTTSSSDVSSSSNSENIIFKPPEFGFSVNPHHIGYNRR